MLKIKTMRDPSELIGKGYVSVFTGRHNKLSAMQLSTGCIVKDSQSTFFAPGAKLVILSKDNKIYKII